MTLRVLTIFFVISIYNVTGQIGGTSVYRFLNLSPTAVQTALGGKQFVSMPHDLLQNFNNPALISPLQYHQIGFNYTSYLTDINYGQLGYVWQIPRLGAFFTGITYLNYGTFTAADETGEITGKFGASETALSLGYAYSLNEQWSVGGNFKFIHSQLEKYSSQGIALDLGLHYKNSFTEWAFIIRNAGFQLTTYNGSREQLPFEIAVSYSKLLEHAPFRFFLTLENLQKPKIAFVNTANSQIDPDGNVQYENIRFYHHIFRHFITGVEIFPRKRFRMRIGFNFRRAAELGLKDINFSSGLSYGFGLRLNKFSVDYGYGQYHFAGNVHHIGINIFLNKSNHEKEN